MITYEEWRVTGAPKNRRIEMVFPGELHDDAEVEARAYIARATAPCAWVDGPHLHKRTVTATDWQEVEP